MKYLVPIDLSQNELQNARMQNLASAPSSPVVGQIYFNTTTNKAMVYDGTNWIPWEADTNTVTGVKGNSESTYRTGNVNITAANVGAAPTSHASTATTYGMGTDSNYGHVKLSDSTSSTTAAASGGTAATPKAVKDALDAAKAYADGLDTGVSDVKVDGTSVVTSGVANVDLSGKVDKVSGKGLSTNDYTTTEKNKLAGIASGAEVNVQSDWNQTTTSADDYIKNKPTLGAAAAKGVDSSISSGSSSTNLPTSAAVASFVSSEIGGVDAMRFKGTIGTGGTVTALPSSHKQGDTYRVITAGTYAGQTCEIGDLIIALGTSGTTASDWTVAQTNIDGAITNISGTTPISVTGSGSSRTVAHENSGVTAASKGDTSNQTPNFGSTFKALSGTVNATGHLTAFAEHTVKIPDYTASDMSKGLMSVADKRKLDGLYNYATDYITSNGTSCDIDLDDDAALNIGQVISVNAYIKETSGNSTKYTKVEVDWYVQILSSSENDYTRVHASISQPAGVPVYVVVVYTLF